AAQAPNERLPVGGRLELLDGGDSRIHTEQALVRACGQVGKELGDGLFKGSSLACVRPTKREQCRSTAQGWRRCEDSPPPRHADSLAPVYRPERSLRLRAGGRPRLATTPPSR